MDISPAGSPAGKTTRTRILSHRCASGHYEADACIVWCFDGRFTSLLIEFVKASAYDCHDLVRVAGGAKDLAAREPTAGTGFLLGQLEASLRLHRPREIVLMAHENCGAYGNIGLTRDAEHAFLEQELARASTRVRKHLAAKGYAGVTIRTLIADFEGLVEIGTAAGSS